MVHPLFEFIRDEASRAQIERFLQCELIRNEVVDDEVALLVVGLQGMQKAVAARTCGTSAGAQAGELPHLLAAPAAGGDRGRLQKLDDYRDGHPGSPSSPRTQRGHAHPASRKMMAYGCSWSSRAGSSRTSSAFSTA
ncbi:hypothetical protein GXW82_09790 [Streptacidiphilus sp. 4-A2]|nr:hypothetical protein [Streptacidiphilus sp. 4-A2]